MVSQKSPNGCFAAAKFRLKLVRYRISSRIKEENKDYYMQTSNTNIPVRWMAIESLYERRYTQFTDVWSFGVVLWEMFSFGEIPYLEGCEQFFIGERNKNHQMITQDLQTWIKRLVFAWLSFELK